MIKWLSEQPWSNGKVGLIGCSSTAEWQMAVAATAPPGLATIIPEGFGAGVGRVKPYYEQGNWYRGGAVQMLFIDWLYDDAESRSARTFRRRTLAGGPDPRVPVSSISAAQTPRVDWLEAFKHLPEQDMLKAVDRRAGHLRRLRCRSPPAGG